MTLMNVPKLLAVKKMSPKVSIGLPVHDGELGRFVAHLEAEVTARLLRTLLDETKGRVLLESEYLKYLNIIVASNIANRGMGLADRLL